MSRKGIVLISMLSIAFVVEMIMGTKGKSYGVTLLIVIILSILYEIYDRRNNAKSGESKFEEKILVNKDRDYYFNIGVIVPIVNFYNIARTMSPEKLYKYENKIIIWVMVIVSIILFLGYGYFYIVSNQILYEDGIKLMDNKFISKDHIKEVVYRRTLILNKRFIEIRTKKAVGTSRRKVKIKCETETEFLKVIGILEEITGAEARNLGW